MSGALDASVLHFRFFRVGILSLTAHRSHIVDRQRHAVRGHPAPRGRGAQSLYTFFEWARMLQLPLESCKHNQPPCGSVDLVSIRVCHNTEPTRSQH